MKIYIIQGSEKDQFWSVQISDELWSLRLVWFLELEIEIKTYSAHKNGRVLLEFLESNKDEETIYITVAGRSNALSGFVAGNTKSITIACPPLVAKADLPIDIWSTLRMPSIVPVMTILEPSNVAWAIIRILNLKKD